MIDFSYGRNIFAFAKKVWYGVSCIDIIDFLLRRVPSKAANAPFGFLFLIQQKKRSNTIILLFIFTQDLHKAHG